MSGRSHGLFTGRSRRLARHHMPSKLGISKIIKQFNIGDKVAIVPKGNFYDIPHPRYKGKIGIVTEKRGGAYAVVIAVSRKTKKTLIVPQRHLEKA